MLCYVNVIRYVMVRYILSYVTVYINVIRYVMVRYILSYVTVYIMLCYVCYVTLR